MLQKSKEIVNSFLRLNNYEIKKIIKKNKNQIFYKKPIKSIKDLKKLIFLRDANLVFKIPISKCIIGAGFNCSANENPLSLQLKYRNKKILHIFYQIFKPNNLADALNLKNLNRKVPSVPLDDLILKFYKSQNFKGMKVFGFTRKDGHVLNGPISKKLISFEVNRLDQLHNSLKKNKWKPKKYKSGFIRGIFLLHKNNFLFKIIGGNHRASVLSFLGAKYLECWFQPFEPRFISSLLFTQNSKEKKIFNFYFDKNLRLKRKKLMKKIVAISKK